MTFRYPIAVTAVIFALIAAVTAAAPAAQRAPRRSLPPSPGFSEAPRASQRAPAPLVSMRLAALGAGITSPRGPYRARPARIAFNYGSYYGAGTRGLWIDHLHWFDWGKPVAYASGLVHARVWPSRRFITTAGGITLDQLRACTVKRAYYTSASMLVPAGFPQNTESTAYAINEQALTPC